MNEIMLFLATAPLMGDRFPAKALLIVVGVAAVVAGVLAAVAGKNKKDDE